MAIRSSPPNRPIVFTPTDGTVNATPSSEVLVAQNESNGAVGGQNIPEELKNATFAVYLSELHHLQKTINEQDEQIQELKKDVLIPRILRNIPVIKQIHDAIFDFFKNMFMK